MFNKKLLGTITYIKHNRESFTFRYYLSNGLMIEKIDYLFYSFSEAKKLFIKLCEEKFEGLS